MCTLLTWHELLRLCGTGAPYLSIMAWVTQTCVVCGPPPKGEFAPAGIVIPAGMGDFCQVMVVVISHRPGFRLDCAEEKLAIRKKQHPIAIPKQVLRMIPPVRIGRLAPTHFSLTRFYSK
jgi:hypothetical protein